MNMWIPQTENLEDEAFDAIVANDDRCDQLTESLCRFIFGSILDAVHQSIPLDETEGWYNPSEKDKDTANDEVCAIPKPLLDHDQNLSYVFASLARLKEKGTSEDHDFLPEFSPFVKKRIVQALLSTVLHPSSLRKMAAHISEDMGDRLDNPTPTP
jgi:hypothetical protein